MSAALHSDRRPVVAVFRAPLFNFSEGFVQAQAVGLTRYQPVVVGLEDKGNISPSLEGRVLLPVNTRERLGMTLFGRYGAMIERVRAHRPVLLHAHFGTDGLTALPIARALDIPLVTTLRGYDVNRSRIRMATSGRLSWIKYAIASRRLMSDGNLFLAVSDALRRQAILRGYPADRTLTHYNGVSLTRFRRDGVVAEPGTILHVGRLVEKKGTAVLLRAFADVRASRKDAFLVIIGEGPLEKRLRRLTTELAINDSVRFLARANSETVADWMRRAWVLAAPSITAADGDAEGLPNVVVEAAASSTPIVGSDHAGIPEAVIHGQTGFVVPQGDVAMLARRLLEVLEAPDLHRRMGAGGRQLAESRFDFAAQMQRLERLYDNYAIRSDRSRRG